MALLRKSLSVSMALGLWLAASSAQAIPIEDKTLGFKIDIDGPEAAVCVANPPELEDEIACVGINPEVLVPRSSEGIRPGPVALVRMTDWAFGVTSTIATAADAGRLTQADGQLLVSHLHDALVNAGKKPDLHGYAAGSKFDMVTIAGRPAVRVIADCEGMAPMITKRAPKPRPSASAAGASSAKSSGRDVADDEEPDIACEAKVTYWMTSQETLITLVFSVPKDHLEESKQIISNIVATVEAPPSLLRDGMQPDWSYVLQKLARSYAVPMSVILLVAGALYYVTRRANQRLANKK